MTVLASILQSLRNAASYNTHELAAPRVILWPDEERLWTSCIEPLRASYPALWSLEIMLPTRRPARRPGCDINWRRKAERMCR